MCFLKKTPLLPTKSPASPFAANSDLVLGQPKHHAHLLLHIAWLLLNCCSSGPNQKWAPEWCSAQPAHSALLGLPRQCGVPSRSAPGLPSPPSLQQIQQFRHLVALLDVSPSSWITSNGYEVYFGTGKGRSPLSPMPAFLFQCCPCAENCRE